MTNRPCFTLPQPPRLAAPDKKTCRFSHRRPTSQDFRGSFFGSYGKSRKIGKKDKKGRKRTKKEGQVQIGKPPRLKPPVLFLCAMWKGLVGNSLPIAELLCALASSCHVYPTVLCYMFLFFSSSPLPPHATSMMLAELPNSGEARLSSWL